MVASRLDWAGLLRHGELDLHRPIIDLRHIVVFDRSRGRGRTAVDHGGRAKEGAELVRVEGSCDERTTLSKKFL